MLPMLEICKEWRLIHFKKLRLRLAVGVIIASLTTDKQIKRILRGKYRDILHQFDVWHFSKNIKTKLCKAAKAKKTHNPFE